MMEEIYKEMAEAIKKKPELLEFLLKDNHFFGDATRQGINTQLD